MPVQIIITGSTAIEAVEELRNLATSSVEFATIPGTNPVIVDTPEPEKPKAEKPKRQKPTPPVAEPEPADDTPSESDEDNDSNDAIPTVVEIRAASTAYHNNDPAKKTKVKELMSKYGVTKLTDLEEALRLPFKRDLEKLS